MNEFAYIDWIRRENQPDPRILVGPGDDCAVVARPAGPLLITTDMLMDGSCFRWKEAGPFRVGRKAISVNLSDIAAMGGRPIAAVVSVGLPHDLDRESAEQLYRGMRDAADRFNMPIAGGDTNAWCGSVVISVTIVGEPGPREPILRSGARSDDWILVTGPLGGSILGKHLDFTPRIREALAISELSHPHAMIDISDGLAKDLHRITVESRCGAVLDASAIPISDDARRLSVVDGRRPLEHALSDGEDFELIVCVSPEDGERLTTEQPIPGIWLSRIGTMVPDGFWIDEAGTRSVLEPRGYEHRFGR